VDLVEEEERVEHVERALPEGAVEVDSGAVDGRLSGYDPDDLPGGGRGEGHGVAAREGEAGACGEEEVAARDDGHAQILADCRSKRRL
jgi:hypothetical protein